MRNNTRIEFELGARCEAWGAGGDVDPQVTPPRRVKKASLRPLNVLEQLVETQVIPRLLLAHHIAASPPAVADDTASRLAGRVGELSELVIAADAQAALAFVSALRDEGLSLETLFQDLLAPTARRLGELWNEDINDFMDVTRGMAQLQLIVNTFGNDLRNEVRAPSVDRRALLMPLYGEQHSFGISLIAEHFRRDGWRVWGGPSQTPDEIRELASEQWFEVIGLSSSNLPDPCHLTETIANLRRRSINRQVTILVGGKVFAERPELVRTVGADATGLDGRQALSHIQELLGFK